MSNEAETRVYGFIAVRYSSYYMYEIDMSSYVDCTSNLEEFGDYSDNVQLVIL